MTDLKNLVFGQLKVKEITDVSPDSPRWRCVCSCGNEICASTSELLNAQVSNCGCSNEILKSESKWIGKKWGAPYRHKTCGI